MKRERIAAVAAVAAVTVWLAAAVAHAGGDAQQQTVWDGVYTEAQATRGAARYGTECAGCHQADLAGDGNAPGLTGPEFMAAWNEIPLSDLFNRIRQSMPPGNPGSVTPADKVDIIAFLLQKNAFPAGKGELPADTERLKGILFTSAKP